MKRCLRTCVSMACGRRRPGGGDARKALILFRHAGETVNERELEQVMTGCIDANGDTTEKAATIEIAQNKGGATQSKVAIIAPGDHGLCQGVATIRV